mmetsp:Transcript_17399/g.47509  ORF Transcript_17399/g.47509 Transcript_17399/m.47509 type:complete len:318 (-) Transcript_17399:138-1091(-)|eukprot:CAMPEP_0168746974 /NCGR_PEP_ID=MMETSP0724-20121128/15425_1 /TAXON_ID=265536 /ORGANISM="Amphiprora sp., Strain CCMP467" /LENGTH=317 /DNA_ID=CAMNT_0008794765 /DNA_START=98 /DNA_END=1051 /DNA_ORIENTATION=-
MTTEERFPTLPSLYFKNKSTLPIYPSDESVESELPAELAHKCLVEYATWGDLAKLSCVQTQWKSLVGDAADMSQEAMWDLANNLLEGGAGLERNPNLAMKYLHKLSNVELDAETGCPLTQQENDENDSAEGTTTSTTNNNKAPFAPAMREIAYCYLTGSGVEANSAKGVAWLKSSHVDGEDVDAAYELAQIFEYGRHETEIDVYAAFEWFEKAAKAGHVEAMAELALCYELGCGVEQSDDNALEWYRRAAAADHATAKYSVGEFFEEARGVPQSDEEACLWYYKAALDGDEDGHTALRRLEDIARIVVPGARLLLDG